MTVSWDDATSPTSICRALLAEIEVFSGTVYVHDGVGPLSWNGHTWLGTGSLGQIAGIGGGVTMDAKDLTVGLTGVPSDLRDDTLNELIRGNPFNLYQGVLNRETGLWDFEPELVFAGFIDAPELQEAVDDSLGSILTIVLPVIAASSYVRRITTWRRTSADQNTLYTGDKFFDFKTDMRIPIPTPGIPGAAAVGGAGNVKNVRTNSV